MKQSVEKKVLKLDYKGFSLVELIIVIAIMAILVGALTPQMLKYVKKAQISSDRTLCDSLAKAITGAVEDPEVAKDQKAATAIDNLKNGPVTLESLQTPAGNKLAEEIKDTLGLANLDQSTYEALLKSPHSNSCEIYVVYRGGIAEPITLWITTTDKTRGGDTSQTPTTVEDFESSTCISNLSD